MRDWFIYDANVEESNAYKKLNVSKEFWSEVYAEEHALIDQSLSGLGRLEDGLGRTVAEKLICDWHFFDEEGGCSSCRHEPAKIGPPPVGTGRKWRTRAEEEAKEAEKARERGEAKPADSRSDGGVQLRRTGRAGELR